LVVKSSSAEKIIVRDLNFAYEQRMVVKNCSFSLQKGKVYCFLGRNGSGKSTLIKLLAGIISPTSGEILLGQDELSSFASKERALRLAYVPQNIQESFFRFSVLDTVVMGRNPHLGFWERPKEADYLAAEESLLLLEINHLAARSYNTLSGGERQLVLLARALTQEADFLLLDEPTSHLDFYYQHQVVSRIKKITEIKEMGVLVAMHDPNLSRLFADEIFFVDEGEIILRGKTDEIMTGENLSLLYRLRVTTEKLKSGRLMISAETEE